MLAALRSARAHLGLAAWRRPYHATSSSSASSVDQFLDYAMRSCKVRLAAGTSGRGGLATGPSPLCPLCLSVLVASRSPFTAVPLVHASKIRRGKTPPPPHVQDKPDQATDVLRSGLSVAGDVGFDSARCDRGVGGGRGQGRGGGTRDDGLVLTEHDAKGRSRAEGRSSAQ